MTGIEKATGIEINAGLVNTELVNKIRGEKTSDEVTVYLFDQKVSQEALSAYLEFVNQAYGFFSTRKPGSSLELTNIDLRNSLFVYIGATKEESGGELTFYPTKDPKLFVRVETEGDKEAFFLQFKD